MNIKRCVKPFLVYSDGMGNVYEDTDFFAAGRTGYSHIPIDNEKLIELPNGSDLFELPGRNPYAFTKTGELKLLKDVTAVAAFLSPAHTQFLLASYEKSENAPILPLFAYTSVCWLNGKFYVPATRIDLDKRQEPHLFDQNKVKRIGKELLKMFTKNRLLVHIIKDCAFTYLCPAARNFVLGRFEAPLPSSPYCNSHCLGCLSLQNKESSPIPCTQPRINFTPNVEEIVEVAVFHLQRASQPIVSFGQGCEGEPLLVGEILADAIKEIRKKTQKGIINLNTNGSLPKMVEKLFANGLDTIRVSLNSARKKLYERYYQPNGYCFDDVLETLSVARKYDRWSSINYFVFPGMTDQLEEYQAMCDLIEKTKPNMIQWRNFNIDPDWYLNVLDIKRLPQAMGMSKLIKTLKKRFPFLYFGYFNPSAKTIQSHKMI